MAYVDYASVEDLLRKEAQANGVNPDVAAAMLRLENGGRTVLDTTTTSPKGARGVTQVIDSTFQSLVQSGQLAPDTDMSSLAGQIKAGIAALKDSIRQNPNDPLAQLAGYNGSPKVAALFKAGKYNEMPLETQQYVARGAKILGIPFAAASLPETAGNQPNVDPISLTRIAQAKFQTGMGTILEQLKSAMGFAKENTADQVDAIGRAASASMKLNDAKADDEVTRIGTMNAALQQFGIEMGNKNTIDQNAILTKTDQQLLEARMQLNAAESVSPVANLPAWIVGQTMKMTLGPQIKSLTETRNAALSAITARQALAQGQQQITPAVTEKVARDRAAAQNEQALALAQIEQAKIKASGLTEQLHLLDARRAFLSDEMNGDFKMGDMLMRQNSMLMEDERFKWMKGKEARANEEENAELSRYNQVLLRMGVPVGALFSDKTQLGKLPKDRMAALEEMATGAASTPDLMRAMNIWNAPLLLRQSAPLLAKSYEKILTIEPAEMDAEFMKAQTTGKKISADEAASNIYARRVKTWKDQIANGYYNRATDDNPLKMNAKIYSANPQLKDNPIARWVTEQTEPEKIKEKDIILFQIGQLKAGTPIDLLVKQASQYYRAGYQYQYENSGLAFIGISPKNPKFDDIGYGISRDVLDTSDSGKFISLDNYNAQAKITTDAGFNMMNPASYKNFLTQAFIKYNANVLRTETDLQSGSGILGLGTIQ